MGIDIREMDDFSHYEYYRYISGDEKTDVGVRVLIDKNGFQRGAETINPLTGQFRNSTGLLSKIGDGLDVEESTEEEFTRLCHLAIEQGRDSSIA